MASILPLGAKWRALVRRKGHKSICKTFPTKAAAEVWARKIEGQLDQGKPIEQDDITIGKLVEIYRSMRDASRPILDTSNEHYMLRRLAKDLGEIGALKLAIDDLLGWAQMRADEGAGPYTINMELGKLGTVYRHACAAKRLTPPDVIGQARPLLTHMGLIGGGGKRERRPNDDELLRVIQHLDTHKGKKYAEAVAFAAINAMRRGEVTSILWKDIDEAKRLVGCWRKHPKKGKVWEWVPLLGKAWEIVQRQPREDDRIFPIHEQTLSKYFKWACDELGIPDLHFHDLRHDGTSRLFEEGYTIEQVALVTGHKDWKNLKRYTNLKPEMISLGTHPGKKPHPGNPPSAYSRRRRSGSETSGR